ncbi:hypothetical protein PG994_000743 [Apiospora phragmitis]|uniref:Zn(2)-C6 fungal-type domain-containing protein n=1 Tax=Apiospora phragmitis TaxID=2905665 RepID=A0ABR1X721_9PEZI
MSFNGSNSHHLRAVEPFPRASMTSRYMMSETRRHKACTQCRDRKIKCDGSQPKCGRCVRYGHECHYAPAAKRCSKADFATMLEAMNKRLLAQTAGIPFMSPDFSFPAGHAAQFAPRDEAALTDMSPATMGNRGETMQTQTTAPSAMPEPAFNFSTTLGTSDSALLTRDQNSGYRDGTPAQFADFAFNDGMTRYSFQPSTIHSHSDALVSVSDNPLQLQLELNGASLSTEKRRRVDPEPSYVWPPDEETSKYVPQDGAWDKDGGTGLVPSRRQQARPRHSRTINSSSEAQGSAPSATAHRSKESPYSKVPETTTAGSGPCGAAARKEGVWDMLTDVCERPRAPLPPLGASPAVRQQYNDDMTYWTNKRDLALGGLEGSLSDAMQARVDNIECARDMWLTLERECKRSDEQILLETMQKLKDLATTAAHDGNTTVARLASQLRELRTKLGSVVKVHPLPDWYFTMHFLLCLPPVYNELISRITASGADAFDLSSEGSFEQAIALANIEERRLV